MKLSRSVATIVAIIPIMILANVVTVLPARAITTAGLAMTPQLCRAVAAREHLTCHHGPLADRGPNVPGTPQVTTALKRVPYRKVHARTAKPPVK